MVLSTKARKPPDRCELMDGWARWCGRWALVEPAAAAEGSEVEAAKDEGLDGALLREVAMERSPVGGGLDGINGDERDDCDAAAI